jgi:hypothetical protein
MMQVTVGFNWNFWARPYRKFGTVREFGFLYCYLTGAGFLAPIRTKKALTQIACRDEAPSAQRLGTHFDRRMRSVSTAAK